METVAEELAGCLRSWRDRLSAVEAGVAGGQRRRVPGLRREEVARLAGVSVDYLARLEQGRAASPSPSVIAALARALRLSREERAHLFRLAGHAEPVPGAIDDHVTPSLQRLLDRLADVPVMVVDAAGTVVAANALATALVGELPAGPPRERNLAWRQFNGASSRLVRTPAEAAEAEVRLVAELRAALGRHPADERLAALIADLRERSPRFAELWERRDVARAPARTKTFRHPEVGELTVDCDVLAVEGSDLRVVVYTAAPGSRDAESLALLGAIGAGTFAAG